MGLRTLLAFSDESRVVSVILASLGKAPEKPSLEKGRFWRSFHDPLHSVALEQQRGEVEGHGGELTVREGYSSHGGWEAERRLDKVTVSPRAYPQ